MAKSNHEIRIVIDDVEIAEPKTLDMRRNLSVQADEIDVSIVNVQNEYTSMFYGVAEKKRRIEAWVDGIKQFDGFIDDVDFTFDEGGSNISCSGRDMTAKLLEMKIPAAWRGECKGLTASRIVAFIGEETGFLTDVETTSRVWPAGAIWRDTSSVWDVISALAEREGFIAYLNSKGAGSSTIVFRSYDTLALQPVRVFHREAGYKGNPLGDVKFLIDRSEAVAKVTVQTYDPAQGKLIKVSAVPDVIPDDGREIVIKDGSLKDKQLAQTRAEAELASRMTGRITGSFVTIYTDAINPEDKIRLAGFADLDGDYFVTEVHDSFGDGSGTTVYFSQQLDYQVSIESEER